MKITGLTTQIITKAPEAAISLFESLGFERRHNKTGDDEFSFSTVIMKKAKDGSDTESFCVEIISSPKNPLDRDLTGMRINVDDFEAACELMEKMGAVRSNNFGTNVTPSSKYQYFILPSGAVVDICYHIK